MTGEPEEPPDAGRGLQIEGAKSLYLPMPYFGCVAVELGDRAREDRELLAMLLPMTRISRPTARRPDTVAASEGDEAQLRVVAVDAEVVHRIAVHRVELHFLAVEERGLGGHRARRHDVAVREDQSALGVDDEPRRLRGGVPLGVERARLVDLDGDDALGNSRQRAAPGGALAF